MCGFHAKCNSLERTLMKNKTEATGGWAWGYQLDFTADDLWNRGTSIGKKKENNSRGGGH
jgi:hypothetical protein